MNRPLGYASLGLGIALLCTTESSATAAILRAGDTLRIQFVTTLPFAENKKPNALYGALGYVTRLQPYTKVTGSLYNGNTLLGVSSSTDNNLCAYTGAYSYHGVPATGNGVQGFRVHHLQKAKSARQG